jgi:uncharacterized membrane protein YvlD (DUF360 family)
MHLLISWIILSLGVALAAAVVPGFRVKGAGSTIVVAAAFGLMNALLAHLVTFVLGVVTLGIAFFLGFITTWIVTAIVLKIVDAMTDRLTITSFGSALQASAIIGVTGVVARWLLY